MNRIVKFGIFLILATPGLTQAKEAYTSSFIENLPALEANSDDPGLLEWTKAGLNSGSYTKIRIPQPYIILSDKNKYKGLQPDQLKLLADRLGAIFSSRFEDIIDVVEETGPGVIVMNLALSDVTMKKKRSLLGYSPTGALLHAARANSKIANLDKLAEKIQLKEANLEVEFVDGGTGELIAVRVLMISGKVKGREDQSWQALRREISDLADRFYENYSASLFASGGS